MNLTIRFQGREFGPFTLEQVQAHLQDGTLSSSDLARSAPTEEWRPLGEVLRRDDSAGTERQSWLPVVVVAAILAGVALLVWRLWPGGDDFPIGVWKEVGTQVTLTFHADGSCIREMKGLVLSGKWVSEGDAIVVTFDYDQRPMPFHVLSHGSTWAWVSRESVVLDERGEQALQDRTVKWDKLGPAMN